MRNLWGDGLWVAEVKSSHLYFYSAFNNTDCDWFSMSSHLWYRIPAEVLGAEFIVLFYWSYVNETQTQSTSMHYKCDVVIHFWPPLLVAPKFLYHILFSSKYICCRILWQIKHPPFFSRKMIQKFHDPLNMIDLFDFSEEFSFWQSAKEYVHITGLSSISF